MLCKRDTKGYAYAKLLNVPMYIHFSEKKKIVDATFYTFFISLFD